MGECIRRYWGARLRAIAVLRSSLALMTMLGVVMLLRIVAAMSLRSARSRKAIEQVSPLLDVWRSVRTSEAVDETTSKQIHRLSTMVRADR